jgi:N-acetylmuramoyl-L-alanine amidase
MPEPMRPKRTMRRWVAALAALVVVAACDSGSATVSPSASPPTLDSPSVTAEPSAAPTTGAIEPAPGSDSIVFPPNPGAILVAIDAGHGGCLDWGVPDPSVRGVQLAEKTLTLDMAHRLRDRLEADGIGVLMIRDADEALAGDNDPELGCDGPPWRDVDGDGNAGFEESGRIRTRDELQARIDLANIARADAFVSIHINSPTEGGQVIEIAFGQTFYDDETAWGPEASAGLADAIQRGTVAAIDPLTTYTRQDRGIEAVAYYAISRTWADGDTCEREGDEFCKPQRGLLMPSALSEVGSITLRAEHDLLASDAGADAVADGVFAGLVEYFGGRRLAGRIGLADEAVGDAPLPVPGLGPPFWPPVAPEDPVDLRLTNTGTEPWPAGGQLVAGWTETEAPYLAEAPADLEVLEVEVPPLAPGDSVEVSVQLPPRPGGARAVAWISLLLGRASLADRGSPALQLSSEAP